MQKYINAIDNHFKKEIDINKKICDIELKISNINNQENNTIEQNESKHNVPKLNDYQIDINSLYNKKYELIKKRKDIQILINKETRKDTNNQDIFNTGKYLMYVYKYYINLIYQFQSNNRKIKLENDILRKDSQIKTLNAQIKLRDDFLKDLKQKSGNKNIALNLKKLVDIKELNLDPCNDINGIKRENNLKNFANNVISANSTIIIKRNISMPFLRNKPNTVKSANT